MWPVALLTILLSGIARSDVLLTTACPPFGDGLDQQQAIVENGGQITGEIAFTQGVKDHAVILNGSSSIRYTDGLFASPGGSLSLWFKKNNAHASGGIVQVGQLGQLNSLGLFYVGLDDLFFEVRNNLDQVSQIFAPDVLAQSEWTHVTAVWQDQGATQVTKLFVNGRFVDYAVLQGGFVHAFDALDIGVTGYYGYAQGVVDEVVFLDWPASDSEVYAEYVYSSDRHVNQPTGKPVSTGTVQLVNNQLLADGQPFTVRGVGYQPVPIGYPINRETLDHVYTDPCILERDLPLLRAMNVNTVRLWSQLPDSDVFLDALYNNGDKPIYAILGFWVPLAGIDYGNPSVVADLEVDFRAYVDRFKDHPAVLAWAIGNENNLAYNGALADWYALANVLAGAAYDAEGPAYHPTLVVNGGLRELGNADLGSDDASLNNVDIWGLNEYFGEDAHCLFDYYHRISAKPLIVTEFGIDSYNFTTGAPYENVQAEWDVLQWQQIRDGSSGGTVMAYSDEWWKAEAPLTHDLGGYYTDRHPDGYSNEEWWGMVSVASGSSCDIVTPRQVYYDLGAAFALDACPALVADLNGDGAVDAVDLAALLGSWGACPDCAADLNGDGVVDAADLATLLGHWGACE